MWKLDSRCNNHSSRIFSQETVRSSILQPTLSRREYTLPPGFLGKNERVKGNLMHPAELFTEDPAGFCRIDTLLFVMLSILHDSVAIVEVQACLYALSPSWSRTDMQGNVPAQRFSNDASSVQVFFSLYTRKER